MRLTRSAEHGLITETVLSTGGGQLRTSYRYNRHGERLALTVNHEGGDGEAQEDAAQEDEDQLYHTRYTRDALGRITGKQEQGQDTSYHYDTAGRLDKVTVGTDETRYRYDDNSNRTHIDNEEVASYDAQDRLLSYQDCDYHYTAYGDLQTRTCGTDISHYRYDLLGNLLSVAQGGQTIDYLVDGEGRRIGRRVDGVLESAYLYKDALNPVARLDNQGRISQRYIYASLGHVPDYLIAYTYSDEDTTEAASHTLYKLVVDQLGSVRLVVSLEDGTAIQEMDYDAWGEVTADSNPGFQPFGYAGGLYDPDTGLVRFGARDYDAETGRWTSKDPILFDGGDTNLYGYVLNDPLNFVDADGLIAVNLVTGAAAGAIGGAIGGAVGALATGGDIGAGAIQGAAFGAVSGFAAGAASLAGITGALGIFVGAVTDIALYGGTAAKAINEATRGSEPGALAPNEERKKILCELYDDPGCSEDEAKACP